MIQQFGSFYCHDCKKWVEDPHICSTYLDLQARIEKLERENAALRARLAKFEALEQWQARNGEKQE